jgi:hypothetical protein
VLTTCDQGCNAIILECNKCKPNQRSCGPAGSVSCNQDGTGSTALPCPTGCNQATGECNSCMPSTTYCNGNVLRECSATGQPHDKQTCDLGCNSMTTACNACQPNSRSCAGDTLNVCSADGSTNSPTRCAQGCANNACCTGNTVAINGRCAACGGEGQPCCNGTCNSPLSCDARTHSCVMPCSPLMGGNCVMNNPCQSGTYDCGGACRTTNHDNVPCGANFLCKGGNCPTLCVANGDCAPGFACSRGACVHCGQVGEPCCGNPTGATTINADYFRKLHARCPSSGAVCDEDSGTCLACGDNNSVFCCPNGDGTQSCSPGFSCCAADHTPVGTSTCYDNASFSMTPMCLMP